ncbi:MAG TPA: BNR-repeat neuraminidase N-terminal domain-containing protein, partial [Tenuifilaceae bacterium]|nr:BNR-repeat neuraminidase N-terminal domain-containing protein [Tenuifilaceae bacterium]
MDRKSPNLRLLFLLVFFILTGTIKGQNITLESFDDETFPPTGWTQAQVFGTGLWDWSTQGYNPACTPQSGTGMARFDSYKYEAGTSAVLISPVVDLSGLSGLKLQIWLYRDNASLTKNDALDLYINTTNSLTGAQMLGTLYRPITANPEVSSPGWYCYDFDVPDDYNGDTNHILIKGTSQKGRRLFIDDVRLYKPVPGNGAPTNFAASNVSRSEMTIQWEDNSTNEDGFRVYISTDGISYTRYDDDIPSTTRERTGEVYSKSISDLLPGTTYYFRIAAFVDIDSEYLEGDQATLPAGTVASEGSGNWSDPDTWSSGSVPAATDNVVVLEGHTVTLDINGVFNQLTVNGNLALRGYELSGIEVTIGETGALYVIEGTTVNLIITGDLNNLGNLDFYASSSIYGRITFTGTNSQTLDAVGTTNIGDMTVNKGASYNHMVEIIANGAFTIKGGSTDSFLTLSNGTIKISGSASVQTVMFPSGGYVVSPSSGIWLNNPNFTVLGHTSGTAIEGLFKLTSGTFTVGSSSIFAMTARKGATMIIEGGTLNLAGRFYSDEEFNFTLSGGTINTGLFYNGTTKASFGITSPSSNVTITGGVINIKSASTADTQEDYNVQSTNLNITGGTLRLGNAGTSSPYTFRIQGNVPNLEIDNSVNPKTVLLSGTTKIYGDITVESGAVLNTRNHSIQIIGNPNQAGDIVNDGLITNTSGSGSNHFTFACLHGGQTLSGTGTFGDVTTPFAAISFSNPAGVAISSSVVANRVDLLTGMVTGAGNITLGNGGVSTPVLQRGGSSSKVVGSVDQAPVFNPGTTCSVIYSLGLEPYSTGFELPEDFQGTLEMASNVNITLNRATSAKRILLSASNAGNLISSKSKLLTISGTDTEDVSIVTGNTGYVHGPIALTLPASLESEAIYTFPIGKGSDNHFELIDPITNALGKTVIGVEVFDVATGGSAGNNIKDGSLGNRYWNAEIISGEDNFVETKVRVSQANPTLALDDGIARSATLTGEYDLVSIDQPVDNTITSDPLTELGYFTIAKKEISQVYQSSTTTHPNLEIAMRGDAHELILGIEVVAVGNLPALEVSNFDFTTSGTTDLADIAKARLFFTGTSSVFSTAHQVGQTIVNPGSTFSITLSEELQEGTNYFWLTYDIADDATERNVVDAGCAGITIGGIERTPSITNPAGNRLIRIYMSGNYLIGVGGDYRTITDAIADLMLVGVNSSVTLLLTDDNYSNDEVFPVTVNSIKNSSADNTVTIKPAADVTTEIVGNSSDSLIVINASNIIIDGSNLPNGTTRDLSIVNEGTDTASGVIRVNEDADNIFIRNIIARSGVTTAGYGISMDGVSNAVINNCKIERANVGIQLSGGSS